jgi:hypothetical protein
MQYNIIAGDTLQALVDAVNEKILDEWVPVGGIVELTGTPQHLFAQAVVKQ